MKKYGLLLAVAALAASPAMADLDGVGLAAEGLTLRAVQDTPTGFGNAIGGGQDSAGGGEFDVMYGDISGGTLSLAIAGNIEGNFNKLWIFIDTKAGGENVLANDNVEGGFNEINNMAGMTFDSGFAPDYSLRFSVGGGFLGVNYGDLQANAGGDVFTAGGPGDLPLSNIAGAFGVTFGWDNSNVLGVDGASAANALTADTGFEIEFDMATAFGDGGLTTVKVMALYANAGGDFLSNQFLPGLDAGVRGTVGNLGNPGDVDLNNIAGGQFAVIPEPASLALLALGGLALIRRRR